MLPLYLYHRHPAQTRSGPDIHLLGEKRRKKRRKKHVAESSDLKPDRLPPHRSKNAETLSLSFTDLWRSAQAVGGREKGVYLYGNEPPRLPVSPYLSSAPSTYSPHIPPIPRNSSPLPHPSERTEWSQGPSRLFGYTTLSSVVYGRLAGQGGEGGARLL